MKYKIIQANYKEQLEEEVNKLLEAGWELKGGLIVNDYLKEDEDNSNLKRQGLQSDRRFYQVMIDKR